MEEKKTDRPAGIWKPALCLAAVSALLSFGTTWAFYSDAAFLPNSLSVSHSGAAMVEEFNPDSSFLPGETAVKKVAFENTGKMDIFLRVEVPPEEAWYENGQKREDLKTSYVLKNWTPGVWIPEESQKEGAPGYAQEETAQWTEAFLAENGKYYRYYKFLLTPGAATDAILESVTLSPEVSNDRHADDYSDKVYKLSFNAEAVPAQEQGDSLSVQAEWGMTVSQGADGALTWKPMEGEKE